MDYRKKGDGYGSKGYPNDGPMKERNMGSSSSSHPEKAKTNQPKSTTPKGWPYRSNKPAKFPSR